MKKLLVPLAILGALLAGLPNPRQVSAAGPPFRVTFLSLDHGEAALIQAPGGMIGLLGVGSARDGDQVVRYLRRHRIPRIDMLIATTWTDRFLGGVPALLKAFKPGGMARNHLYIPTPVSDAALRAMDRRGIKTTAPTPGERISLFYSPPCALRAVAPTGPMLVRFAGDLRCSTIFELEYDRVSVLCLGATARKHQQAMWSQADLKPWGHVLQIGHDGAADSLLASMLKPLKTRYAVLTLPRKSGARPAAETLAALKKAGVKVYRTDRDGNITVITDGTNLTVSTSRS